MTFRISNENMDAIDAQLAQAEQGGGDSSKHCTAEKPSPAISQKLGTPPMGRHSSCCKRRLGDSLDSVCGVYRTESPSYGSTVTIQTVNLEKTFVITERLNNNFDSLLNFLYAEQQCHYR